MSVKIELEDSELILLDGKCSESAQTEVNAAKDRIAMIQSLPDVDPKLAAFAACVVSEAKQNLLIVHRWTQLRSCPICGQSAGYSTHKRSGRYHRAGTPNYDKPLYLSGVELADRFISMKGYVSLGCCNSCFGKLLPILKDALKDIKAEIPESILGVKPLWKRHNNMKCTKCGWMGHEGEMIMERTFMCDGWYPAGCPNCKARNLIFGRTIVEIAPGYALVEIKSHQTTSLNKQLKDAI